jgi:hypothetical protein
MLGVSHQPIPYPSALTPWLHSKVQLVPELELRTVLSRLGNGAPWVFVKPAKGWKRFTGIDVEHLDHYRFRGLRGGRPLGGPNRFVSDWRVYVAHKRVRAVKFADHSANRNVRPDGAIVGRAVRELTRAELAPEAS